MESTTDLGFALVSTLPLSSLDCVEDGCGGSLSLTGFVFFGNSAIGQIVPFSPNLH